MNMRNNVIALAMLFALYCRCATAQNVESVNIDGAVGKLAAVIHKPKLDREQKCPMVILCHGFGGNKEAELLIDIADTLQSRGIAAIRFDFNGHGKSEGEFVDMTVPNEIDDAKCVYRYAVSLPYVEVSKVGMAGHSQGGVVTSMAAGDLGSRLSAIVLLAPAAVLRDDAIRGNTMGATYNPLAPPEYVLLFGKLKLGRKFIKSAFTLPIYETAAKYHGPACMIHGTGDRIAPYTYSERYHDLWPGSELHILNAVDHGFSDHVAEAASLAADYLTRFLK